MWSVYIGIGLVTWNIQDLQTIEARNNPNVQSWRRRMVSIVHISKSSKCRRSHGNHVPIYATLNSFAA
jgi:hypothetical protein